MKGIVTDIQRFCLHDGPGIRTVVFLKGCNLKCGWCHNPETIKKPPELLYYSDKCIGCGLCYSVCPSGALTLINGKRLYQRALCKRCWKCTSVCSTEALLIAGKEMNADDVMKEVLRDKPYYLNSNGGITISGGELLCQKEFTYELLLRSREEGISTAIETNLMSDWKDYEDILDLIDLIMFDIKIFDKNKHKQWTGASNQNILENAKRLDGTGKQIIVRTPVIPGVNDNSEEICDIVEFIKNFNNLLYYELIPYNPLAEEKYAALGKTCPTAGLKPPDKMNLERIVTEVGRLGVKVRLMEE